MTWLVAAMDIHNMTEHMGVSQNMITLNWLHMQFQYIRQKHSLSTTFYYYNIPCRGSRRVLCKRPYM